MTELGKRGFDTAIEPGRAIVKEQLRIGGDGLPWDNQLRFVELVIARSMRDYDTRRESGQAAFFDRSIVDSLIALDRMGVAVPESVRSASIGYRYGNKVFMTPPWSEIYRIDAERRHSFDDALTEYHSLLPGYERLGYELVVLPKLPVAERADFVLRALDLLGH